jgi:histidyl-tRNA synthetase
MPVERCKGTRDMDSAEMARFRAVEEIFRDNCLKWGYGEVRTPTLEYLHLFTSAGTLTPARLGKVYSFLDWDGWSGERVVLRPDGTIPIARFYIETIGEGPARLFYVNNVFSFEETGTENREKWQCGVELIGHGSPEADVELVVMALGTLKQLGLENLQVRLSHAGLIRAILSKIGSSREEQTRLFDRFLDGDTQALVGSRPELAKVIMPMLETNGKSSGFLRNVSVMVSHDMPELKSPLDNFIGITSLLDDLSVKYEVDIASGRGFEYYTGLIFQIWCRGERVAGGGRYDELIPLLGGKDTPASGYALDSDKLIDIRGPVEVKGGTRVLIRLEEGSEAARDAFAVLDSIHQAGFIAEIVPATEGSETVQATWLLKVGSAGWRYSLRNLANGNIYELATVAEVIQCLKS